MIFLLCLIFKCAKAQNKHSEKESTKKDNISLLEMQSLKKKEKEGQELIDKTNYENDSDFNEMMGEQIILTEPLNHTENDEYYE